MLGYLYVITNTVNNKKYVGKTINFEQRKQQHLSSLRKGIHHSHKLQRAYNKYGEDKFVWEKFEIEVKNDQELALKEIQAISYFNSYENGYNETYGGDGNKTVFDFDFSVALYHILQKYDGIYRKIANYYQCDHTVIDDLSKNALYSNVKPQEELIKKIITEVGITEENLKENYKKHNDKKLSEQQCYEILSVVLDKTGYEKTLCEIFNIDSKATYRLKNGLTYKEYFANFQNFSSEQKKEIQNQTFQKYDLESKKAQRKRNGVKDALTQEQINYILDNQNNKTRVQIGKDLGISAYRVGDVILGKSYKDLVACYYSQLNETAVNKLRN